MECPGRFRRAGFKTLYAAFAILDLDPLGLQIAALPKAFYIPAESCILRSFGYITNVGIQFRHEIGKDVHAPGFYMHIAPEEIFLGVGTWHPEANALKAICDHIVAKPGPYEDALEHQPFKEIFTMAGDSLSRPPKGYDKDHPLITEIKRKDFIALCPLQEQQLYQDDLCETVAKRFARAQPLQKFICEALGLRF